MRAAMIGREIGVYKITRTLGKGGMGTVYLAEHTLLGRPAAIKVLLGRWRVAAPNGQGRCPGYWSRPFRAPFCAQVRSRRSDSVDEVRIVCLRQPGALAEAKSEGEAT